LAGRERAAHDLEHNRTKEERHELFEVKLVPPKIESPSGVVRQLPLRAELKGGLNEAHERRGTERRIQRRLKHHSLHLGKNGRACRAHSERP
jgi:hypothetical protein